MWYIVALGNPGEKYAKTRHNIGWLVADSFIGEQGLPAPVASSSYSGLLAQGVVAGQEVTVLYPTTYMNHSGVAVKKLVPVPETEHLVVVYDDIDLPFGEYRIAFGKGSGGHNGVQSIVDALKTKNFIRLRVGIAPQALFTGKTIRPKGEKLPKYVLGGFGIRERAKLAEVCKQGSQVLTTIINEGHLAAMNTHHQC